MLLAPVPRLLGLIFAMALAGDAFALELKQVELSGIDAELAANVRAHLSIDRLTPGASRQHQRDPFFLSVVAGASRGLAGTRALRLSTTRRSRRSPRVGEQVTVRLIVQLGEPVRVRALDLLMRGPGRDDAPVAARVAAFHPLPGELFHHAVYESSKAAVARVLAERGYFDAELETHRVEVTRAERAADIDLSWTAAVATRLARLPSKASSCAPACSIPWCPGSPARSTTRPGSSSCRNRSRTPITSARSA